LYGGDHDLDVAPSGWGEEARLTGSNPRDGQVFADGRVEPVYAVLLVAQRVELERSGEGVRR
jgi:hypothetical protein